MKALAEAKAVLLKEMRKLEAEKASYDDRIYRLQQAIGAMDIAEALKRAEK